MSLGGDLGRLGGVGSLLEKRTGIGSFGGRIS